MIPFRRWGGSLTNANWAGTAMPFSLIFMRRPVPRKWPWGIMWMGGPACWLERIPMSPLPTTNLFAQLPADAGMFGTSSVSAGQVSPGTVLRKLRWRNSACRGAATVCGCGVETVTGSALATRFTPPAGGSCRRRGAFWESPGMTLILLGYKKISAYPKPCLVSIHPETNPESGAAHRVAASL